jgi:hypothetical protein
MLPPHELVKIGKSLLHFEKFDLAEQWVPAPCSLPGASFAGMTTKRARPISILSQALRSQRQ